MKKIILTAILVLIPAIVFCQASDVLFYQAEITDQSRNKLDGTYTLTFSIFADPTGGSSLWSQTISNVTIDKGNLSVFLGGTAAPLPSNLFDVSPTRYLQIAINDGATTETLIPRQKIVSGFYSLKTASGSSDCPSGMVKVQNFCIDTSRSGPATYYDAVFNCDNRDAHVCQWYEQMTACEEGVLDINASTTIAMEWNPDHSTWERVCVWGDIENVYSLPYCYMIASDKRIIGGVNTLHYYRCCK